MTDITSMQSKVKDILEMYPSTRSNDHELYILFFENEFNSPFTKESFLKFMQSFESVSRARRKVQENFPELKDEDTAKIRSEMEEIYRETYSKH